MRYLLVFICMLNLVACGVVGGEDFFARFTIFRDGEIVVLEKDELLQIEGIQSEKDRLNTQLEYDQLPNIVEPDFQDLLDIYRAVAQINNNMVDSDTYDFMLEIPLKSEQDLKLLPVYGGGINLRYCDDIFLQSVVNLHVANNSPLGIDGFFHYKLYVASNVLARHYVLNNVVDRCFQYRDVKGSILGGDSYDIQSNTLTIPAEEIKLMLDGLGIIH